MPITIEKVNIWRSGGIDSCELGLDCGLSGPDEVAWVRGLLQTHFGAPSNTADEYKGTFEYQLCVHLEQGPVHVHIGDDKGWLHCGTPELALRPENRDRALRAIRHQLQGIVPVDYEDRFLHHDEGYAPRYGCHHGAPYVLEHGPIRFEVEPVTARAIVPGDAELEAFYARTAPPGSPPLASIRDHVLAAYVAAHRVAADDPLAARAAALQVPVVCWARLSIDRVASTADHAPLSAMIVEHSQRWMLPGDMLAWTRAMITTLDGWLEGGIKKPVVRGNAFPLGSHGHIWHAIRAELDAFGQLLADLDAAGRRAHLLPPESPTIPFDSSED